MAVNAVKAIAGPVFNMLKDQILDKKYGEATKGVSQANHDLQKAKLIAVTVLGRGHPQGRRRFDCITPIHNKSSRRGTGVW